MGNVKNYRPISGLTFLSKVIEKVVAKQLVAYLVSNDLLPRFQSGFRRGHSTETAILRMLSDIHAAINHGRVVLLALLDVSAAFDKVDHDILLERLSVSFGGSVRFCHPALNSSVLETLYRRHHRSVKGSLKVKLLGLCCISSIQRTLSTLSGHLGSPCSSMLMIPSSMATACPRMLRIYQFVSSRP